ncbi:hypothetical protein K503DRAFT_431497 [Rhizopogon vinicolor AM-OR11-026]|uniref:Uncharacterized protein n=1 Tax=Rhizopogon vinicolor AM-OR11-026 TaxID=1314800 RepID=A0A1B7NAQ3_9AGAM|nr:hypothetical protein K503DRAFT_431497 [Rhizopogon vinicolor AM-OR11-026]
MTRKFITLPSPDSQHLYTFLVTTYEHWELEIHHFEEAFADKVGCSPQAKSSRRTRCDQKVVTAVVSICLSRYYEISRTILYCAIQQEPRKHTIVKLSVHGMGKNLNTFEHTLDILIITEAPALSQWTRSEFHQLAGSFHGPSFRVQRLNVLIS